MAQETTSNESSRREFLRTAAVLSVGAAMQAGGAALAADGQPVKLPQLAFGKYSLSRLVCGANPFGAWSHLSVFVSNEMRAYYTPERIIKTLKRCEEVGVNCWQSSGSNHELYRRFTDEGGKMHYISLADAGGGASYIQSIVKAGGIGIAHHGEVTDSLFKQGKLDKVGDYLKQVHDAGLMAGVSTHMPVVVDAIESKGWEVDFYMTCVYERHRSEEDLRKLLGQVPIPQGEVYLREDPPRMFKVVRASKRPCLAFKILAAGRLSERKEWVERAFKETLAGIKPGDGIIVGMYDKFSDQAAENAEYVRKYGAAPTA